VSLREDSEDRVLSAQEPIFPLDHKGIPRHHALDNQMGESLPVRPKMSVQLGTNKRV
jgi:hypothetical protein